MKITFINKSKRLEAHLPFGGADHVLVAALSTCPDCGEPLKLAGREGTMHHDHDTYYTKAGCLACEKTLGELQTKVSTIFGIDEDEAVLVHGRARVY